MWYSSIKLSESEASWLHPSQPHLSESYFLGNLVIAFSTSSFASRLQQSSRSPPATNHSQHQGLFHWVSSLHQVAKRLKPQLQYQSFQWIFRVDFLWGWLVWLLAVQGTLKSLVQHHSKKASVLWCSVFFMVQLSHPYMTTGKTKPLMIWTFVGKWCLCFLIVFLGLS